MSLAESGNEFQCPDERVATRAPCGRRDGYDHLPAAWGDAPVVVGEETSDHRSDPACESPFDDG